MTLHFAQKSKENCTLEFLSDQYQNCKSKIMEGNINDEASVFNLAYKGDLRQLQAKIGQKERYVLSKLMCLNFD